MEHVISKFGHDIDLSKQGKRFCPVCREEQGADHSGDNLHVYGLDSNGKHGGCRCFSCDWSYPSQQFMEDNGLEAEQEYDVVGLEFNREIYEKDIRDKTSNDPRGYRGINQKTSIFYGVRYAYDENGEVVTTYYPTTTNGRMTGMKVRKHPKDFTSPYGETGKDCELFGQVKFKTFRGTVLLVGGEHDALAAFQMLENKQTNKNYNPTAVVSATIGESGAWRQVQHNYEFFNQFSKIVIAMDTDEAGRKAMEKIIEVLPRNKVFIMNMRYKDPNEYLKNGDKSSEFSNDFWAATQYVPVGVKTSANGMDEIAGELSKPRITLPPYMHRIQTAMGGGIIQGRMVNIIADTSTGKCLAKGTKVRMADMSIKNVEDIRVGEFVLGADGSPRKVLNTTSGVDNMYQVDQADGMSYTVNSEHILSLRAGYDCPQSNVAKGDVVNIKVTDYIEKGAKLKRSLKGYKAGLENYGEGNRVQHPYLLGLWLADGTKMKPEITCNVNDVEIIQYIEQYSCVNGWGISVSPSSDREGSRALYINGGFRTYLTENSLIGNKHIPNVYLNSCTEDRMSLLAGILDGDGHVTNGCYEIIQKSKELADDIVTLAKSLGFKVTISVTTKSCQTIKDQQYYRMFISGEVDNIPVKTPRKKVVKSDLRRKRNTAITVTHVGVGEYYGFGIDGDHLFCLEDFTVTHNSTHVNRIGHHLIFNSPEVPTFVTLEATAGQFSLEMLAIERRDNLLWNLGEEGVIEWLESEEGRKLKQYVANKPDGSPRYYMVDERGGDITSIQEQAELMWKQFGSKVFVFDVLTDMLRGSSADKAEDHLSWQREMCKNGITFFNVLHTRKPTPNADGTQRKVTEYDALGTGSFVQSAAINIVLRRDKMADSLFVKNTTEVEMPKCRGGLTGEMGGWYYDWTTATCHDADDWAKEHPESVTSF